MSLFRFLWQGGFAIHWAFSHGTVAATPAAGKPKMLFDVVRETMSALVAASRRRPLPLCGKIPLLQTSSRASRCDKGAMNRFTFDSSRNEIKGKLRQTYGQLMDDDLCPSQTADESFATDARHPARMA